MFIYEYKMEGWSIMRQRKLILMLIIALAIVFVSACNKENGKDNGKTNAPATATPEPTTVIEATPTQVPGPTLKPITAEEKGKPHPQAEVLLKEDFEDGEINPDEFKTLYDEYIKISD